MTIERDQETCGWPAAWLARQTGYNERTIRRFIAREAENHDLIVWLDQAAAWLKRNPPPGKKTRGK